MKRLDEIFDIWYGVNLEVVNCEVVKAGMPFVSRQSVNNGIVCHVKPLDITPNPANTLSIAASGSVLTTFYHDYEYYSGRDVYIAQPKIPLSIQKMLFYCYVIEQNKYRYNYGRAANRTLRDILVPTPEDIPLQEKNEQVFIPFDEKPLSNKHLQINTENWKWFDAINLFDMYAGKYYPNDTFENGEVPLVTASETNNGIMKYTDLKAAFPANCLTIGKVGMSVFYQPKPFCASPDVTVLRPKLTLSKFAMLFVKCILDKDKYRWNYGRQIRLGDSMEIKIKLPTTADSAPDWQFMEDYIKGLPYSGSL